MVKDRVLIADDSSLNQKLLSAILGNEYEYVYAKNGLEVMEILEKQEPVDIILLDINMPKLDGFEVLRLLNEKHFIEHIPVVIISVENDEDFVRKAYELGATDYIARPFNAIVVTHRVKNTLMLYSNQKRLVRLVENQIYEREKTSNAMINIFSNIIELRNHESGSHTLHVQVITNLLLHSLVKITDKYKLTESDINLIASLSALHDIGKISIPEEILNKPGKLTDEEWVLMKNHTVEGYEILCHANIEQNNQFMKTAKDICRYHHEKFDGRGYPDGLVGDSIPISAQVVSVADVYDALTSVRCYKRAFTHDEAIRMILNGECGTFNPLLIEALKAIEPDLKDTLNEGLEQYDFHKESLHMANEILSENNLPVESTHYMLEAELVKRDFFESVSAKGIQFEYDALLHKVRLINTYIEGPKRVQTFFSSDVDEMLLSEKDWLLFLNKMKKTTRKHPRVTMKVLVKIDDHYRWHLLTAISLWPEEGSVYIGILGQFTDIHNEIVNAGLNKLDSNLRDTINSLRSIFTLVRLVDPIDNHVLTLDEGGNIVDSNISCFQIWNKNKPCENCTSSYALKDKKWSSKLEVQDNTIYSVLSRYVKVGNKECVLEVAFPVSDDENKSLNRKNLISNLLFLDFYRDSLTKAYSRTYLEDFHDNLDKALGVALVDADGFKKINDTYGHTVGDVCLKLIAKEIIDAIKDIGIAIRYGGDEFLLVFNKITTSSFYKIIEEIKTRVKNIKIEGYNDLTLQVSVGGAYSIGSLDEAINVADKEMYKFKMKH